MIPGGARDRRQATESDRFVHHEHQRSAVRGLRRQARLHRYQYGLRKALAVVRKERFGLDIEGAPHEVADARRLLRNARKPEARS